MRYTAGQDGWAAHVTKPTPLENASNSILIEKYNSLRWNKLRSISPVEQLFATMLDLSKKCPLPPSSLSECTIEEGKEK